MFDDDDFEIPDDMADMADVAAAALASMGEEYAQDASKDAEKLLSAASAAHSADDDAKMHAALTEIFEIAHNFKGQGATFGYDLLTTIGDKLCEITRPMNNPTRESVPKAVQLCGAIHMILEQRLTGDGGDVGTKLCSELGIAA